MNQKLLMKMDVLWLEQTLKHDHWDFTSHSELQNRILLASKSNRIFQIYKLALMPTPELTEFRNFTLIYVLQHFKKGHIEKVSLF